MPRQPLHGHQLARKNQWWLAANMLTHLRECLASTTSLGFGEALGASCKSRKEGEQGII